MRAYGLASSNTDFKYPITSIVLYFFESIIDFRGSCRLQPLVFRFHRRDNSPIWGGNSQTSAYNDFQSTRLYP
jgi:hypothetical protein